MQAETKQERTAGDHILVYDQLYEPFPEELGRAMVDWTGDEARQMDVIRCAVTSDLMGNAAHYTATDGHRLIRVICRTRAAVGDYIYFHYGVLRKTDGKDPPYWATTKPPSFLSNRDKPSGKWSFDIAYVAMLGGVEKALQRVQRRLLTTTRRETKWQRAHRHDLIAKTGLFTFELGGELDPMIAHASGCGCDVTAYIMPRKF